MLKVCGNVQGAPEFDSTTTRALGPDTSHQKLNIPFRKVQFLQKCARRPGICLDNNTGHGAWHKSPEIAPFSRKFERRRCVVTPRRCGLTAFRALIYRIQAVEFKQWLDEGRKELHHGHHHHHRRRKKKQHGGRVCTGLLRRPGGLSVDSVKILRVTSRHSVHTHARALVAGSRAS